MRAALITGPPHTNLLSFRGAPFSARARRDSGRPPLLACDARRGLSTVLPYMYLHFAPPSARASFPHRCEARRSGLKHKNRSLLALLVVALSSPVSIHSKTGASPCVGATHRLPCPLSFMHVHIPRQVACPYAFLPIDWARGLRTASRLRVSAHRGIRFSRGGGAHLQQFSDCRCAYLCPGRRRWRRRRLLRQW